MSEISRDLSVIGDSLQRAWHADHARDTAKRPTRRRLIPLAGLAVLLIAAGGAIGATIISKSSADEEQGLLHGYALFKGTHPACTRLTADSFFCRLDRPPIEITFYSQEGKRLPNAYLGIKAETVNSEKRVDGGCVATTADGRSWRCYLGEAAVANGVVDRSYLGTYLPEPPTA
jgi:hypothetical protein